jgi:transposase
MGKRIYRSTSVNVLDLGKLVEAVRGRRITFAIDVAKWDFKAVVMERPETVLATLSWQAPQDTRRLVEVVSTLATVSQIEVALEPTGTYGDVVRALLRGLGLPVFRVSTKRSRDAAELYDGVPSQHDAKCAAIVGWLHNQGRSEPWPEVSDELRDLAAAVELMVLFDKQEHACANRLEAKLARHFPELTDALELGSATMLALLETYGTPERIAKSSAEARTLMVRVGGSLLSRDKIERVLEMAKTTTGTKASAGERALLIALATETNRQRKQAAAARRKVEELGVKHEGVQRAGEVLGKASAAVLFVEAGDPSLYRSADAYAKALGLNLKIKNSGKPADHGRLKITKRGAPRARFTLYMAVLRLIQRDERFKAWYGRKVERDGGQMKLKAVVALMRKLAKAIWHVSRGSAFDSAKLFDDTRLGLAA